MWHTWLYMFLAMFKLGFSMLFFCFFFFKEDGKNETLLLQ